jgi:hypothetical protein
MIKIKKKIFGFVGSILFIAILVSTGIIALNAEEIVKKNMTIVIGRLYLPKYPIIRFNRTLSEIFLS